MHPGEVLTEFVRALWHRYVQCQLTRDLTPMLDVEAVDGPDEMAVPPALNAEGTTRPIAQNQAEASVPLSWPVAEARDGDR